MADQVSRLLDEIGQLDADQFEELFSGLVRITYKTAQDSEDPAWARVWSHVSLAKDAMSERIGS